MKDYGRILFYFLFFIVVLSSCDNFEDVPPQTNDEYFVSSVKIESVSKSLAQIQTLISIAAIQYPDLADIQDEFTSGIEVYKLTYKTTFNGVERLASGLVSLPTESGTYPMLSFQNGTNTLHSDAPSQKPDATTFQLLEMMASTGFVIVIPDYLGFGEADDMFHPYLDKESTVQSVLDMLRAVEEMIAKENDIELNEDLYITGYSQGGWATMAVQEAIDKHYSSEFNLKASACGGGPHNLIAFSDFLLSETTYPMPYFPAYLFNSYMNLEMTTPIDSIFQQPYADKIPGLFDGTRSGGELNAELTQNVNELITANFIANWNKGGIYESLYTMLDDNSNYGYSTSTPMMFAHGAADVYVPASLSESLYQEFINAGVSTDIINIIILPGLDHTDAVVPAELAALTWFIGLKNEEAI